MIGPKIALRVSILQGEKPCAFLTWPLEMFDNAVPVVGDILSITGPDGGSATTYEVMQRAWVDDHQFGTAWCIAVRHAETPQWLGEALAASTYLVGEEEDDNV